MENCNQRSPIKLTTLQEARDIHRSKSSLGCKTLFDNISQCSTEKSLTSIRCNARVSDSAKRIHSKSIENNKSLIEKAFAVKLAFSSPFKERMSDLSVSPNKSPVRKSTRAKTTYQPVFLQKILASQNPSSSSSSSSSSYANKLKKKPSETEGKDCKNEMICFIKGLEKIRCKLLRS